MSIEAVNIEGSLSAPGFGVWLRHTAETVQIMMPAGVEVIVADAPLRLLRDLIHAPLVIRKGPVMHTTPALPYVITDEGMKKRPVSSQTQRAPDQCPVRRGWSLFEADVFGDYMTEGMLQIFGILSDGSVMVGTPRYTYTMTGDVDFLDRIHSVTTGGLPPNHFTTFKKEAYWFPSPDRVHVSSINISENKCGNPYAGMEKIIADYRTMPDRIATACAFPILGKDKSIDR